MIMNLKVQNEQIQEHYGLIKFYFAPTINIKN